MNEELQQNPPSTPDPHCALNSQTTPTVGVDAAMRTWSHTDVSSSICIQWLAQPRRLRALSLRTEPRFPKWWTGGSLLLHHTEDSSLSMACMYTILKNYKTKFITEKQSQLLNFRSGNHTISNSQRFTPIHKETAKCSTKLWVIKSYYLSISDKMNRQRRSGVAMLRITRFSWFKVV